MSHEYDKDCDDPGVDGSEDTGPAILVTDLAGTITTLNPAAMSLLGWSADQASGRMRIDEVLGIERLDEANLFDALADDHSVSRRIVATSRSKETILLVASSTPVIHQGNKVAYVHVLCDLRASTKAKEMLARSEARFRNLYLTVQQGAFFSTRDGRFTDFNPAMQHMLRYDRREDLMAVDIPTGLWIDPAERSAFQIEVEKKGDVKDYATRFRRGDGEIVDVLLTVHALTDRQGRISGYQGFVNDVTERRRMQEQLVRTEKMATLGTLSASVAHELNNPLGGIYIYAHLLLEKTPLDDPRRGHVDRIMHESTRCKDIIQGLLNFSRQSTPSFSSTDVNRVISAVLDLLEAQTIFENIGVEVRLGQDLPCVVADAPQLEQVFVNIMLNAAEALDGKGTITVSTSVDSGSDVVKIRIEDDGPGISERVRGHLFEPFVTTKDTNARRRGTGLGLAISYSIVVRHKGSIEVETKEGRGTAFIVTLPAQKRS